MHKADLANLQKHFDDKLIAFSAPGLPSLLVCHDTDPGVFKVLEDNDDDGMIQSMSKAILKECKHLVHNKDEYTIRVDKQTEIIIIGNTITSAVTNRPTPLQVGLGTTLGKKSLVQQFHDLGVCC